MFKLHRPGVTAVLMAAVLMLTVVACGSSEPVVQEVEVPVEVTREVDREVQVTREVDREVQVTREVDRRVEVTREVDRQVEGRSTGR